MTLTAVEAFARQHDDDALPANERYYRDLIPLEAPGDGEQYGFEVDLDACTGCKACVTACHSLNGLDDDESWRSVGFLQGGSVGYQQTVTTACHHCVEPACLAGCPVDAYEKDPLTGIVAHLDDQCIGCGYCTWTCPYEVPRFNEARGIVRKCDLCRGRLAVGEAPACVQACPNGAIRVSIVNQDEARSRAAADGASLVPGAPPSSLTVPTTVYRTTRQVPADVRAADHHALRPAHPHPPLAAMLVLTQLAVGQLAIEVGATLAGSDAFAQPVPAVAAAVTAIVALATSTAHLGRPRYAFRAVLGLRHSWLSREVLAFGAFGFLVTLYAAAVVLGAGAVSRPAVVTLGVAAVLAGAAGVGSSVMLYAVTRRAWWAGRRTARTFGLSALLTGSAATLAVGALPGAAAAPSVRTLAAGVAVAAIAKVASDVAPLRRARRSRPIVTDLDRSALLLRRDLADQTLLRTFAAVAGGVVLPLLVVGIGPGPVAVPLLAGAGLVLVIVAELLERHHFFRVSVAPRMPGELR